MSGTGVGVGLEAGWPFVGGAAGSGADAFDPAGFEATLRSLSDYAPRTYAEDEVPADFRRSSVLILFWHEADDVAVLLTRRGRGLREHPGMMAFPGGRLEAGEDWQTAALRETEEEVGIPASAIEVLGRIDDAWSGTRYRLASFVGWLPEKPTMRAETREVDSIHTPRLRTLLDPNAWSRDAVDLAGERFYNGTLRWDDAHVFGLTTDLLVEAIQRGLGLSPNAGEERLDTLRAWLRREAQTR